MLQGKILITHPAHLFFQDCFPNMAENAYFLILSTSSKLSLYDISQPLEGLPLVRILSLEDILTGGRLWFNNCMQEGLCNMFKVMEVPLKG